MYIWFETDALVEYAKLFGLKKAFRIDRWESHRDMNPKIGYFDYLRMKHSSFAIRLLTCPPCLLVWISSLLAIFSGILAMPVIYVSSYIIYIAICRLKRY